MCASAQVFPPRNACLSWHNCSFFHFRFYVECPCLYSPYLFRSGLFVCELVYTPRTELLKQVTFVVGFPLARRVITHSGIFPLYTHRLFLLLILFVSLSLPLSPSPSPSLSLSLSLSSTDSQSLS